MSTKGAEEKLGIAGQGLRDMASGLVGASKDFVAARQKLLKAGELIGEVALEILGKLNGELQTAAAHFPAINQRHDQATQLLRGAGESQQSSNEYARAALEGLRRFQDLANQLAPLSEGVDSTISTIEAKHNAAHESTKDCLRAAALAALDNTIGVDPLIAQVDNAYNSLSDWI
jgi:glycine cleavage system regulatory protein